MSVFSLLIILLFRSLTLHDNEGDGELNLTFFLNTGTSLFLNSIGGQVTSVNCPQKHKNEKVGVKKPGQKIRFSKVNLYKNIILLRKPSISFGDLKNFCLVKGCISKLFKTVAFKMRFIGKIIPALRFIQADLYNDLAGPMIAK